MVIINDTNFRELETSLVDNLKLDDYICWGIATQGDSRKRDTTKAIIRLDDVDFVMGKVAEDYWLRRDKLCWFSKDENSLEGVGHTHVLIGHHNLPKNISSRQFSNKLNRTWKDNFGWASFLPFDNDEEEKMNGLRYLSKTRQRGVTVMNDYRFSKGLRRRLGWLQEQSLVAHN